MDVLKLSYNRPVKSGRDNLLRVMVVDNHEIFRYGLRSLLNDINGLHVVAEASCCKDALAQIEVIPIDLVLLDPYLPDSEGIETVQQLRRVIPSPQIIIISAVMDDDVLLNAMLVGVSGYLTKGTSASDIVKALQGLQRGELAMLPSVAAHVVRLFVQRFHELETEVITPLHNGAKSVDVPAFDGLDAIKTSLGSSTTRFHQMLTPQEENVFQLMCRGQSNKQIAAQLFISHYTVGKHVQNIFRKLGVTNRTQAVSYALFEGGEEGVKSLKDEKSIAYR